MCLGSGIGVIFGLAEVESMTLANVVEIAALVVIVVVAVRFFYEAGVINHETEADGAFP